MDVGYFAWQCMGLVTVGGRPIGKYLRSVLTGFFLLFVFFSLFFFYARAFEVGEVTMILYEAIIALTMYYANYIILYVCNIGMYSVHTYIYSTYTSFITGHSPTVSADSAEWGNPWMLGGLIWRLCVLSIYLGNYNISTEYNTNIKNTYM